MTLTAIHIYRAKDQPATRYRVELAPDNGIWVRCRRRTRIRARCCKRTRIAGNLIAHVYYDGVWFYCRRGKGCKS